VRPNLLAEGGNLEVVDMKQEEGALEIYVSFQGNCAGCPSSRTGTQRFIEAALRDELDPSIRVIPV
jgi:Fe-S cluster biogenesis protein NfuA